MFGDMPDVIRSGPAATADDIDESLFCPFFDKMSSLFGLFVVFAHGVRQAGIGVGRYETGRYLAQLFDMRPHLPGAESAIQTDAQRAGVHDRYIECLQRLPAKRASARIGNRTADRYGQFGSTGIPEVLFNGVDRCFGIEGIEYRLDQQEIDTAFYQPFHLLVVRRCYLIKAYRPKTGVVDIRR